MRDCQDFVPFKSSNKYCDLSTICRQLGMISELVEIIDVVVGKSRGLIYMCIGNYIVFENRFKIYKKVVI